MVRHLPAPSFRQAGLTTNGRLANPLMAVEEGKGSLNDKRPNEFELIPAGRHNAHLIFYLGHAWYFLNRFQHTALVLFRGRVPADLNKPLLRNFNMELGIAETCLQQGRLDSFLSGTSVPWFPMLSDCIP